MAEEYQFNQTGAQIQTILDAVGTLEEDMTTAQGNITSLQSAVNELDEVANSKASPLTYSTYIGIGSYFDTNPTSSSAGTYTFTDDGWLYIFATRGSVSGYTLNVIIDDTVRFNFPAYDAYAVVAMLIPVTSGQVLKITTDSASATWTVRELTFMK